MTLPNFMIIGVAKAGTTSFYRYLDQHPQVFMCPVKGSNYFGYEDATNWRWFDEGEPPMLRNFQATTLEEYESLFTDVTNEVAIGEASPQYFRCPLAATRIHDQIPDAKIIVSLRNPADRAFSGFLMRARRGETVGSIEQELSSESSHVKEGFYYTRMKRYFDAFERSQIKVIIFEEFKNDSSSVVTDLFGFLGVDVDFNPDTSTRYNAAAIPKSRLLNRLFYDPSVIRAAKTMLPPNMQRAAKRIRAKNLNPPPKFPPALRTELLNHYRDDILRLETLIDRDLSAWLKVPETEALQRSPAS